MTPEQKEEIIADLCSNPSLKFSQREAVRRLLQERNNLRAEKTAAPVAQEGPCRHPDKKIEADLNSAVAIARRFEFTAPVAQVAQAEGFVLVPVEPTDDMLTAARWQNDCFPNYASHERLNRAIYSAMLAAAQGATTDGGA